MVFPSVDPQHPNPTHHHSQVYTPYPEIHPKEEKMTLGMLQDHIQELIGEAECLGLDPDELKVAVALQPNWPLAAKITNFKIINEENPIVWVATTQTDINGSPYAPKEVWDEC